MTDILIMVPPGKELRPETVRELSVSRRLYSVEGKIQEVIDFLKMYEGDPDQAIKMAIQKLEEM